MEFEAIITSVGYGDFLAYSIPTNRHQFHYTVVATTPEDVRTQKVCEYWNVHCIQVPEFHLGGGFRKGAGINAAIKTLRDMGRAKGWLVHMDADIVLPPLAMGFAGRADFDPTYLYGVDRMMVENFSQWADFLSFPVMQHECKVYAHARPFKMGTRIVTPGYGGWVPIGFFQMWNPTASGVWEYPSEHTSAGRGDMLFAKKWPRNKRGHITDFIVYHLESETAKMGVNWNGRTTQHFGPEPTWPAVKAPWCPGCPAKPTAVAELCLAGGGKPDTPDDGGSEPDGCYDEKRTKYSR